MSSRRAPSSHPQRPWVPERISQRKAAELLPRLLDDWDRLASRLMIEQAATRRAERQLQRQSMRAHRATLRADEAERAVWASVSRPGLAVALLLRSEHFIRSLPDDPCPSCRLRGICRPNCRRTRLLDSINDLMLRDFVRGFCQGCGRGQDSEHAPNCPLRQEIQLRLQF